LTGLLSQGIDVLLDSPAMEFRAERTGRDGKTHQLGMEYLPAHWRDQVNVAMPESSWQSNPFLWTAAAGAVALAAAGWILARRRKLPVAVAPAAAPPAPAAAAPPNRRATTIAEPASPTPPRVATTVEPRPQGSPSAATAAPKAARPATQLATANTRATAGANLAISAGPHAGQRFALSSDVFWIGSATNNHLCLGADPAVSGNHACIRREQGFLRLYDNGSLNNTILNGRPIGTEVVLLRVGDCIRIGQSELRLEA
jgi:hypothetical protein